MRLGQPYFVRGAEVEELVVEALAGLLLAPDTLLVGLPLLLVVLRLPLAARAALGFLPRAPVGPVGGRSPGPRMVGLNERLTQLEQAHEFVGREIASLKETVNTLRGEIKGVEERLGGEVSYRPGPEG